MKVYICKACGFFWFTGSRMGPCLEYGKTFCPACREETPEEQGVELGVDGYAKYDAIVNGLQEYERARCEKKQIALFE